jgi:hypothetical protein
MFGLILLFEFGLLRLNYLARQKSGFMELNWLWRFFDKRGLMVLTLPIHFILVVAIALYAMLMGYAWGLGFIVGALGVNFEADRLTWNRFMQAPGYHRCSQCGTMMPVRPMQCPRCERLQ